MTHIKLGHIALKINKIRNDLPIGPFTFTFNQHLCPCNLSQIGPYGLKSEPEKNAYPKHSQEGHIAFCFYPATLAF